MIIYVVYLRLALVSAAVLGYRFYHDYLVWWGCMHVLNKCCMIFVVDQLCIVKPWVTRARLSMRALSLAKGTLLRHWQRHAWGNKG